jgi:hypothetical protein
MKYQMLPIHVHKLNVPNLEGFELLDGILNTAMFVYPKGKDKSLNALRIDWKYRVSLKGEYLFTFLAESKFIIQDDGIPFDDKQFDRFIGNLYLNAEIGWEDNTRNTKLYGRTLPTLKPVDLAFIRQEIIDLIQ